MKRILAPFLMAITFSVMFSSPSYAGWTKVSEGVDGRTYYVDFERIRKHDGFVYYWELSDYLTPSEQGHLSYRGYMQGDCKLFRSKSLSYVFHKEPMGGGTADPINLKNPEWKYPPPNSNSENILKSVCAYKK